MPTRRDLFKKTLDGAALVAPAPTVPTFLARTARAAEARRDGRVLVVIQLDGGNDAINTLVPFRDEGYAKHRQTLRLDAKDLIKVNGDVGLHPALRGVGKLLEHRASWRSCRASAIPIPNRSHFESMAIWHSARLDPEEHAGPGWLGRGPGRLYEDGRPGAAGPRRSSSATARRRPRCGAPRRRRRRSIGSTTSSCPRAWPGRTRRPRPTRCPPARTCDAYVRRSTLDAYAASRARGRADGPRSRRRRAVPARRRWRGRLRTVARLLKGDLGRAGLLHGPGRATTPTPASRTRISACWPSWPAAIKAFLDDLAAAKLADRVVVLGFSEFGRRVAENSSAGTDHGTAGLVFLAGPGVKAGVHGKVPSLTDLVDGDPRITTDFRRVYASVLDDWLGLPEPHAAGSGLRADGPVPGGEADLIWWVGSLARDGGQRRAARR